MSDKPNRQAGARILRSVHADAACEALMVNAKESDDFANVVVLLFATQSVREATVERINQFAFYELGKALKTLATHYGDVPRTACLWDLFSAQSYMEKLLSGIPIPLGVSKHAAEAVKKIIDDTFRLFYNTKKEDGANEFRFPQEDDTPISSYYFNTIRKSIDDFETVFSAEMGEATSYFVPRKGIYSTPALAEAADGSFPSDLIPFIPGKTKDDWRAAGRCLAFNLLSASGFHVARAVEGIMESYYQLFSGNAGKTLRSWDDYHKELAKIAANNPTPAPEPKTLIEFDQMRQDYRNPIVHPRVTLNEADSRILFNNGESLIIAMASEIKTATTVQGGVQPALIPVAVSP